MSSEADDRCTQASGPQLGRQTCLPMDLPPAPLPASYRFPSRLWAGFLPPWSPEVTERDFFQNRLFHFTHQHLPNLYLRSTDLLEITRCKPTPEDRHAVFVSPVKLALLGEPVLRRGAGAAEASPPSSGSSPSSNQRTCLAYSGSCSGCGTRPWRESVGTVRKDRTRHEAGEGGAERTGQRWRLHF